jgi:hypothetical protein
MMQYSGCGKQGLVLLGNRGTLCPPWDSACTQAGSGHTAQECELRRLGMYDGDINGSTNLP